MQQPPPEQEVEVQQVSPGPPHSAQTPPRHTALESQGASAPVQQVWPFIPHGGFDEQADNDSSAINAVTPRAKRRWGQSAYVAAGLFDLFRRGGRQMTVEADGFLGVASPGARRRFPGHP